MLNGGTGNDTLVGGTGNDTYVTDGGDTITEASSAGTDLVKSSIALTLGSNLENLTLTGSTAINGTGNVLANAITGNTGNNSLSGLDGNDTLNGGTGNDTLVGGTGADNFVFNSALGSTNVDKITDFKVVDDTIQLENAIFSGLTAGALSATAFVVNTSGNAADASDRIIYESDTGNLYFDSDGLGATAKIQVAQLSAGLALTSADFFVL